MNEKLLQFIWQFQYYSKTNLTTEANEPVEIIHQGSLNSNEGPDFAEAKVKIGDTLWAGSVELHVKASHWNQHRHNTNDKYRKVILHVVWEADAIITDLNKQPIPTLELQMRVPKILLDKYRHLMQQKDFVPCQQFLPVLSPLAWLAWKERLAIERLQEKSIGILQNLEFTENHWEEIFWWKIASNFGIKVNAQPFEQMAKTIPVNVLAKHKNQIHQLEALLMGQCGLLQGNYSDSYPQMLQKEYAFLAKKYKLKPIAAKPDFLRMRPASFPTLRLSQLASLIHHSSHLFSSILHQDNLNKVKELFNLTAIDYWHYHYLFDEAVVYKPKITGEQFINNIVINTIIPVMFAYGIHKNEEKWKDKAVTWLMQIKPEQNTITKKWSSFHVQNKNALESQALLHLKKNYCEQFRCLSCAAGNGLLKIAT